VLWKIIVRIFLVGVIKHQYVTLADHTMRIAKEQLQISCLMVPDPVILMVIH
jgi:hypothetical protein